MCISNCVCIPIVRSVLISNGTVRVSLNGEPVYQEVGEAGSLLFDDPDAKLNIRSWAEGKQSPIFYNRLHVHEEKTSTGIQIKRERKIMDTERSTETRGPWAPSCSAVWLEGTGRSVSFESRG